MLRLPDHNWEECDWMLQYLDGRVIRTHLVGVLLNFVSKRSRSIINEQVVWAGGLLMMYHSIGLSGWLILGRHHCQKGDFPVVVGLGPKENSKLDAAQKSLLAAMPLEIDMVVHQPHLVNVVEVYIHQLHTNDVQNEGLGSSRIVP
jgi:hypothetical protein